MVFGGTDPLPFRNQPGGPSLRRYVRPAPLRSSGRGHAPSQAIKRGAGAPSQLRFSPLLCP